MFKVLIVEDEKLFREYMYNVIDWTNSGFTIVGEACTGLDALEQMEIKKPNLVLVDINMPKMDGLTFIEHAKAKYKDVVYLIITGYSEFEYAQKAIKIGVTDYLLKPFDANDFNDALEKAKINLIKKQQTLDNYFSKNILLNFYFNQLINGYFKTPKEQLLSFLYKQFGQNKSYYIMVLEKDYLPKNWNTLDQKELWKETVMNIIDEIQTLKHHTFIEQNGRIVCFVFSKLEQKSIDTFKKIANIIKEMLGFSVTLSLSKDLYKYEDASYGFSSCTSLLDKKLILGCGKVLLEESKKELEKCLEFEQFSIDFNKTLSLRNDEDVISEVDNVFKQMKQKNISMEVVSIVAIDIISDFIRKLNDIGLKINDVFGNDFMPFSAIKNSVGFDQIKENVKTIVSVGVSYLSSKKFTRAESITKMAKDYINEHYANEYMKAEDIADFLHINTGYLRTVFKKETNITISRYIFVYRMEQSKKFIAEGFMKLSEVAYLVGFSDSAYFSKCFKKHYGISPSEFYNINNKTI